MKKRSGLIILVFLLLITVSWSIIELTIFGDAIIETAKIKSFFNNHISVQRVVKMESQKDFSACYNVYFISTNSERYVFLNAHIENDQIYFYKFYKTDSQFNWIKEVPVNSHLVSEQLDKLR